MQYMSIIYLQPQVGLLFGMEMVFVPFKNALIELSRPDMLYTIPWCRLQAVIVHIVYQECIMRYKKEGVGVGSAHVNNWIPNTFPR